MSSSKDPARNVIERPGPSIAPYFAIAVIAAVALWSFLQPTIEDPASHADPAIAMKGGERSEPHSAEGEMRTLFSADDYPAEAQRRGEEGTVQAELAVDSSGRVTACTILRSSGSASLDSATCRVLQRRARFTPARDADGNPRADRVTTPPIKWQLED